MAQQIINTGTSPNDGTGDTLKTSFTKTNANFSELYTRPPGNAFTSSPTVPSSPNSGDLWYDTSVGALSIYLSDGNSLQWVQVAPGVGTLGVSGSVGIMEPQGRLTLDTAYPVMTASNSGNNVVYYAAYTGTCVPIFDGTMFSSMTFPSFLSCATADTSKNPSPIGANKINDWFVWNDAGVLRLCHGVDWTNDTTRNTSNGLISRSYGLWLNNSAIANGPGAYRGTYVGTTRSTPGSAIPWITGGSFPGGIAAVLGVWNCYNRANVSVMCNDTTASWVGAAAGWRMANGSANMRISFVSGLTEDVFQATYSIAVQGLSSNWGVTGVGFDSTTVPLVGPCGFGQNSLLQTLPATVRQQTTGFHYFQALESSLTGSNIVWFGTLSGSGTIYQSSGFVFDGRM